jgi:hypothetical protein
VVLITSACSPIARAGARLRWIQALSLVRTTHAPEPGQDRSLRHRLKIAFHDELADLGVQTFDLALTLGRAVAIASLECPRRLLLKLLLPGVDLMPRRSSVSFCSSSSAPSVATERLRIQLVNRSQFRGPFQTSKNNLRLGQQLEIAADVR